MTYKQLPKPAKHIAPSPTHPHTRMAITHLQELPQDTHGTIKETNICKHNLAMKTYRLSITSPLAAGSGGGGRRASGYGLYRAGRT